MRWILWILPQQRGRVEEPILAGGVSVGRAVSSGCLLRLSSQAAWLISPALETIPGSSPTPVWGEGGESPAFCNYTTVLS